MSTKLFKKYLDKFAAIVFFGLIVTLIGAARVSYVSKAGEASKNTDLDPVELQSSFNLTRLHILHDSEKIEALADEQLSEPEKIDSYIYEITSTIYRDVDPEIVRSIAYHESRYKADVVNPRSGTIGLMQLSPKWHTERAKSLGVTDLKDPYGNILTGCDLLHELLQTYPQNYALDVYAGGYAYADSYRGTVSPFVKEIYDIRSGLRNGSITPGGD